MISQRKTWIDGKKIEEFLWEDELVVYIDNRLEHDKTYDEIIKELMGA